MRTLLILFSLVFANLLTFATEEHKPLHLKISQPKSLIFKPLSDSTIVSEIPKTVQSPNKFEKLALIGDGIILTVFILTIVSFFLPLGILGSFGILAILAFIPTQILGHLALKNKPKRRKLVKAGLIFNYSLLFLAGLFLALVLYALSQFGG
jgi:hypothetical protein